MAKIQTPATTARPTNKIYSVIELESFDAEIKSKYRVERTLSNGEKIMVTDYKQMHRDHKTTRPAVSEKYEDPIIVEQTESGEFVSPTKYSELQEKISQYQDWRRKKEFGEKMRLEGLDKLAKTMAAPAVIVPEE